MDGVTDHQERLEGDHDFVVFHVIADEHENGFPGHVPPPKLEKINRD